MPSSPVDPADESVSSISRYLEGVRTRLRFWSILAGSIQALLYCLILLVSLFLFDYVFEPGGALQQACRWLLLGSCLAVVAGMILPRFLAPPSDLSLAEFIESRSPELLGRLLTSLESKDTDKTLSPVLLHEVQRETASILSTISLTRFVRVKLLARWATALCVLALSIGAAALLFPKQSTIFCRRVLWLDDLEYPRATSLELAGFAGKTRKVARGRDAVIEVLADPDKKIPERVVARVRSSSESRTRRVFFTKVGAQRFTLTMPTVSESLDLAIQGGDDSKSGYRLEVVEPPRVVGCRFEITPPAYVSASPSSPAKKLSVNYVGTPVSILEGSTVQVWTSFSKPGKADTSLQGTAFGGTMESPSIWTAKAVVTHSMSLRVRFQDDDGIELDPVFPIEIVSRSDSLPRVEAMIRGIGNAVTPSARIPMNVKVEDDYGLSSVELKLSPITKENSVLLAKRQALPLEPGRRDLSADPVMELQTLELPIGSKWNLEAGASDFLPTKEVRRATSDSFSLEVVSPAELLARLGTRELNLRQRFEQLLRELKEVERDVTTARTELSANKPTVGPLLLVDRSLALYRKIAAELAILVADFSQLRDEIVNNQIQNPGLLDRLERGILEPMKGLAAREFPQGDQLLATARRSQDPGLTLDAGITQLRRTYELAQEILANMQKLESFSEAIRILRSIIGDTEQLRAKLKQERKNEVLDILK